MVIPPNASPRQRKLLNEYRHEMIYVLNEQERQFRDHVKFFKLKGLDTDWLEDEIKTIQKTRLQYE